MIEIFRNTLVLVVCAIVFIAGFFVGGNKLANAEIEVIDPYIQIECSELNCTMYSPRTGKTWHKWCKANEKHCFWIPMEKWDGVGIPPGVDDATE